MSLRKNAILQTYLSDMSNISSVTYGVNFSFGWCLSRVCGITTKWRLATLIELFFQPVETK